MRVIQDHRPSQYEQHRDCMLLLSVYEWKEIRGHKWIREATKDEIELERERLTSPWRSAVTGEVVFVRTDFDELHEHDGETYLWVIVSRNAPGHIWRQASVHLRIRRFSEDG